MLLDLHICETKLKELDPKAHKLRKSSMLNKLEHRIDLKDADSRKEVQRIIVKEGKKKWKQIHSTLSNARSLSASKVATKSENSGRVVHLNEADVHLALKEHLDRRC